MLTHFIVCLGLCLQQQAPDADLSFEVVEKIEYSEAGGQKLLLDAYIPKSDQMKPAVLVVHGGAWRSGNRKQLKGYCEALAGKGFVCFAIDYRLAPQHKFPAQIDDCRSAVKWIRQHAETYKADASRLGAIGYSAGGHLVSLLATTGEAPSETNGNLDTRLTAVAAGGAPTDFRWFPDNGKWAEYWMGGSLDDVPENFKAASAVPFVDKDDPPIFFFNGTSDTLVPLAWTKPLHDALLKAGVKSELHTIEGAGHMQAAANKEALTKAYEFLLRELQSPKSESAIENAAESKPQTP
jgi:acetyl esterase/lipase